ALALFDPDHPGWEDVATPIAAGLVRQNPLFIGDWSEVFQPIDGALKPHLRAVLGDHGRPAERELAYSLLLSFATRPGRSARPVELAELVAEASPNQFRALLDRVSGSRQVAERLEA